MDKEVAVVNMTLRKGKQYIHIEIDLAHGTVTILDDVWKIHSKEVALVPKCGPELEDRLAKAYKRFPSSYFRWRK